MEIPENFNIMDFVTQNNLGPDKLAKLQKLAHEIKDPSKISPEQVQKIITILATNLKPEHPVGKKINRNDQCPCKSGKKYKKCCM